MPNGNIANKPFAMECIKWWNKKPGWSGKAVFYDWGLTATSVKIQMEVFQSYLERVELKQAKIIFVWIDNSSRRKHISLILLIPTVSNLDV